VLTALRNPHFRLLWLGTLSAFVGFNTSNIVQSLVAFQLTSKNYSVGLVVFARGFAQLLLATPTTNLLVIPIHQHLRRLQSGKLRRPGVVRVIEQAS